MFFFLVRDFVSPLAGKVGKRGGGAAGKREIRETRLGLVTQGGGAV